MSSGMIRMACSAAGCRNTIYIFPGLAKKLLDNKILWEHYCPLCELWFRHAIDEAAQQCPPYWWRKESK